MNLKQSIIDLLSRREPHTSLHNQPHAYASEALSCSRKIALRLIHSNDSYEEHDPHFEGLLAMRIGEFLHSTVQAALLESDPLAKAEFTFSLGPVTGRADGTYEQIPGDPSTLTVLEIKSMTDTMYNRALKKNRPDEGHIIQAMLGAKAINAPYIHMIYINRSSKPGTTAYSEWILPYDDESTSLELERLSNIVEDSGENIVPEPYYNGDIILNPDSHYWPCGFCSFREECKEKGPESYVVSNSH